MRVPDTITVNPEQGHGRMNLPDRNSTQVVPVDINMGKLNILFSVAKASLELYISVRKPMRLS